MASDDDEFRLSVSIVLGIVYNVYENIGIQVQYDKIVSMLTVCFTSRLVSFFPIS